MVPATSQFFAQVYEIHGGVFATAIIDLNRRVFNTETRAHIHFDIRIRARINPIRCPNIQPIRKHILIHNYSTPSHFNSIQAHNRIRRKSHSRPLIFSKLFNIRMGYPLLSQKLQNIFLQLQHYLRKFKKTFACRIVLVARYYLSTHRIEVVGD
jgi:hypothetical protein